MLLYCQAGHFELRLRSSSTSNPPYYLCLDEPEFISKQLRLTDIKYLNTMNKIIIATLLVAVALSGGCAGCQRSNWVSFRPGAQNIFNFGCGQGNSWGDLYGVSSAGYNFKYTGLPSWITVQNGAMLAGTPGSNAGASAITVTYNDRDGNSRNQAIVLAPFGASPSSTVSLPNGLPVNGLETPSTFGSIALSQLPSAVYIPGSTSPAGPSTVTGTDRRTTTTVTETTLTTVVLPAPVYPTPSRLSIVPPDAPTAGVPKPSAPVSNPQEDATIIARQEAAIRGLANAIDAINRANNNVNTLNSDQIKAQNDLNNALDYLQNTRNSLRDAQAAQRSNSDSVTTTTNDITNLQSQINAAQKDAAKLRDNIADVTNQLNTANGNAPVLQKTLDDILAAIANAQKAISDAQNALDNANSNIVRLRKIIADAQFALDNAPTNIRKAQDALNAALDAVTRARRALADAETAAADAQKAYDDAVAVKTTAPRVIAEATNELNKVAATVPGLEAALANAKANLDDLNRRRGSAIEAINANNRNIDDLTKRLAQLNAQLANTNAAIDAYNSQLIQAKSQLTTLRSNQAVLDDNVGTLTEQLGLAENNANNARSVIEDINNQINSNNNLLTAAKVALEKARTEKALSDQEVNDSIQRSGGTFPYPYIPGTGPWAMPGVTGNPQSNTVNPYAPGTTFGTGPGTTGGHGTGSGLPISVPNGSPYATQSNSFSLGGVPEPTRVVAAGQAANVSPSNLFPAARGAASLFAGNPSGGQWPLGKPYGKNDGPTVGGAAAGPCGGSGTSSSGSGRIVSINGNTIVLSNGSSITFGGCSEVVGTPKVGGSVNWSGYTNKGTAFAKQLNCF